MIDRVADEVADVLTALMGLEEVLRRGEGDGDWEGVFTFCAGVIGRTLIAAVRLTFNAAR